MRAVTLNVLPESVELEGTLRTHRTEVQQNVKARVGEIAAGFASAFSAQIDITVCRAYRAGERRALGRLRDLGRPGSRV